MVLGRVGVEASAGVDAGTFSGSESLWNFGKAVRKRGCPNALPTPLPFPVSYASCFDTPPPTFFSVTLVHHTHNSSVQRRWTCVSFLTTKKSSWPTASLSGKLVFMATDFLSSTPSIPSLPLHISKQSCCFLSYQGKCQS